MKRRYTVALLDTVTGARVEIVVEANTKAAARAAARADYHGRTGRPYGYHTTDVTFTPEATP